MLSGPVWGDGDEDAKLADAISGSLRVADELGLKSIALPAISTGIYGFPKERAAKVIYNAILEYFSTESSKLKTLRLVLFDKATAEAFLDVWKVENG
jgi:O-acetyl-ADP-ribose deacetylase